MFIVLVKVKEKNASQIKMSRYTMKLRSQLKIYERASLHLSRMSHTSNNWIKIQQLKNIVC